jgi:uncharacterized protein (DUF1330 family)
MAAYLIVDLDVHDPSAFEQYKAAVPALISKHGGEYLVRGGALEVIEGNWQPKRLVLLRFPDRRSAKAFLDDPDYQPLAVLRQRVAPSNMVMVDSV